MYMASIKTQNILPQVVAILFQPFSRKYLMTGESLIHPYGVFVVPFVASLFCFPGKKYVHCIA